MNSNKKLPTVDQVRDGGRRGRGKNVLANQLYFRGIPRRVHPHRVRELLGQSGGGRPFGELELVGHRRSGGLRQVTS